MSLSIQRSDCCGLRIVSGIERNRSPKNIISFICDHMFEIDYNEIVSGSYDCAFILFADESPTGSYGNRLSRFIQENGLGTVKESIQTGTRAWIWEINRTKAKYWFKHNR